MAKTYYAIGDLNIGEVVWAGRSKTKAANLLYGRRIHAKGESVEEATRKAELMLAEMRHKLLKPSRKAKKR